MTDHRPSYSSDNISIFEWGYPTCEIYDKRKDSYVHIDTVEDAIALIESLNKFLDSIPVEFGGNK